MRILYLFYYETHISWVILKAVNVKKKQRKGERDRRIEINCRYIERKGERTTVQNVTYEGDRVAVDSNHVTQFLQRKTNKTILLDIEQ